MFEYCGNNAVFSVDPAGEFSATLAVGLIGGVIGGIAQIATNALQGNKLYDGVVGAFVGGFIYNSVSMLTAGNTVAAAYLSAAGEATANQIVKYFSGEKKLSGQSILNSVGEVFSSTVCNGSQYLLAGKAADGIKVNWNKISQTAHYFIRRDAPAIITQSTVQAIVVIGEKITLSAFLS